MRVLLHPGLHKTGSSSIQESLNRLSLGAGLYRSPFRICLDDKSLTAALRDKSSEATRWLLISNESLFGEFMDFYARAETRMSEIVDRLGPHEIHEVTFFFRDYGPWLESCFSQLVHEGASGEPVAFAQKFLAQERPLFSRLVESAQTVFGSDKVSVQYLSRTDDAVSLMSRKWSEAVGFDLGLKLPNRLNTTNRNPAALWMLAQMNANELGKLGNYRLFLQNLKTDISGNHSFFPESLQKELVEMQREDAMELEFLLRGQSCANEARRMLEGTNLFYSRPYWEWPSSVLGMAELFASATAKSRLEVSRLSKFKSTVVRLLGPWTVWTWQRVKKLIGNS